MVCEKRAFESKRHAHDSVRTLSHTVRVYLCEDCGYYHVAKRSEDTSDRRYANRRKRSQRAQRNRRGSLDFDN